MTHFGSGSKNGPIHRSTDINRQHEIIDANWVLPPTATCTVERDKDAEIGIQENIEPTMLLAPIAKSSWLKSIS